MSPLHADGFNTPL